MSERPTPIRTPMFIMLGVMLLVVVSLGLFKFFQISRAIAAGANFAPPPTAITTFVAAESEWNPTIDVVGSLEAAQGVWIRAEDRGKVEKIGFESGAAVNAGDLLVQLDISVETAQIQAAEAKADLARVTLKRNRLLKSGNAVAEASLDEAVAALKQAEGEVAAIRAVIEKKTITAPFSGRSGIRTVNVGDYVAEGAQIAPLYSPDPMFVNFAIPQTAISQLSLGQTVRLNVDTYPNREFFGKVTAIDPQIDTSTRNVRIQATLPNGDTALKSGMFASVHLLVSQPEKRITIPGSAINRAPYGDSVFIVEKGEGKKFSVSQKFITVGTRRGDQVAVLKGLEVGQEVATSGLFKLRPGAAVVINNDVMPSNSANPTPADT